MTTQKKKLLPYNTVPQYICEDYRSGKISVNQLRILLWLRAIGTPYGKATTSLIDLKNDVFPDLELKTNTINSYLLKLRQKQYIYFELRQGKTGTFTIELNHWLTPKGGYKILDKYFPVGERRIFGDDESDYSTTNTQRESSEDRQKLEVQNQKLEVAKAEIVKVFSLKKDSDQIRSYHNDTDTERYIQTDDYSTSNKEGVNRKKVATRDFRAKNDVQMRCKEIALEIRDPYINFILGKLKRANNDIRIIERGFSAYKEACHTYERNGKRVGNPAALFNKCLEAIFVEEGLKT